MPELRKQFRRPVRAGLAGAAAALLGVMTAVSVAGSAQADTTIDGPINLGTASAFSVLAYSAVTNTGPSSLSGDLGVSPLTAISGFPPGLVAGSTHSADPVAAQAQADTGTAYDVAASLSPTQSGLTDLTNFDPVPGVYSGGALTLSGTLTLDGPADAVWVFQAASSLITSVNSTVQMTGGATACNVFWQVGSSASLGVGSTMVGTVMALASIDTGTGTTVVDGRLLARNGAVTLDNTSFMQPDTCTTTPGTVTSSPTVTSGTPPTAGLGVPFAFRLTSSGTGTPTFSVTSGGLAPGLVLDSSTGMISGTPTSTGSFPVGISVDNGIAPAALVSFTMLVAARLAETGVPVTPGLTISSAAILVGLTLLVVVRRRRPHQR